MIFRSMDLFIYSIRDFWKKDLFVIISDVNDLIFFFGFDKPTIETLTMFLENVKYFRKWN